MAKKKATAAKGTVEQEAGIQKKTSNKEIVEKTKSDESTDQTDIAKKSTPKKAAKKAVNKRPRSKKAAPPPELLPSQIDLEHHERLLKRAHAETAYFKYRDELAKLPGVTAVTVGSRFKGGKPTGEMAIRLHMGSEEEKQNLRAAAIAGTCNLQKKYDGVPIDLLAWKFKLSAGQSDGAEIHSGGGLGTLGTTVNTGGGFCYLTAGHVIQLGSSSTLSSRADVRDSGGVNIIGQVPRGSRFFFKNETMDAALIVPLPLGSVDSMPPGRVVGLPVAERQVTIECDHAGGTMIGFVDSPQHPPVHNEDDGFLMTDHFLVRPKDPEDPLAKQGNSGSIVMDGNKVLGILRASVDGSNAALVCKITNVLVKLGFQV